MRIEKEVRYLQMKVGMWLTVSCRRKECCHSFEKGDVLKHMSILIKISNHLGLILPGDSIGMSHNLFLTLLHFAAPSDTTEQVSILCTSHYPCCINVTWRCSGTANSLNLFSLDNPFQNTELPSCSRNTAESGQ